MPSDRKKPGWAFWATVVVIVMLVGYPLSWGPACCLRTLIGDPPWAIKAYWLVYGPVLWLEERSPKAIQDVTYWYCSGRWPSEP